MKKTISVTVNGVTHQNEVEPRLLLVQYIRDVLNLTGTHVGCETSLCGACTIMVDGQAIKSCTMLAAQADIIKAEGQIQQAQGGAAIVRVEAQIEPALQAHGGAARRVRGVDDHVLRAGE